MTEFQVARANPILSAASTSLLTLPLGPPESSEHAWFYTRNEISTSCFTWTIENFSFYLGDSPPAGRRFSSGTYTEYLKSGSKYHWNLVLDPHYAKEDKIWVVVILETSAHREVVQAKIKYSLLGVANEILHTEEYSKLNAFGPGMPTVWWKILRQDLLRNTNLYPNDCLTVRCEITICNNPISTRPKPDFPQFHIPPNNITGDMIHLYQNRLYADVTIRIGRRRFKSHKAILSARSDVFSAMFEHDMKEKLESTIIIKDIDGDVFEEVLRYIYTGEAQNMDKLGLDLLAAAEKYGLERLKAMCEQEIAQRITPENASIILYVADFHNSLQLRRYAMDYINSIPERVITTDSWKALTEQGLHLVPEIYVDLVHKSSLPVKRQRIG